MTTLRLTAHDDVVVRYTLEQDGAKIGEVHHHGSHAAILRIGTQAWWLADDVEVAQREADASLARRLFAQATQPRSYSLRADGGVEVLARAVRRWRWKASEDGVACEVGGVACRIRAQRALGGRFALEDAASAALGQFMLGGFGRIVYLEASPFAIPQTAFLLYAAHRNFGRDPGDATGAA